MMYGGHAARPLSLPRSTDGMPHRRDTICGGKDTQSPFRRVLSGTQVRDSELGKTGREESLKVAGDLTLANDALKKQ